MKVILDLDALLAEGKIDAAEFARLEAFAVKDSGSPTILFAGLMALGIALALVRYNRRPSGD